VTLDAFKSLTFLLVSLQRGQPQCRCLTVIFGLWTSFEHMRN